MSTAYKCQTPAPLRRAIINGFNLLHRLAELHLFTENKPNLTDGLIS